MTISLGRAVLELATDSKAFIAGFGDAKKTLRNFGGLSKQSMTAIGQASGLALAGVTALASGIVALGLRGAVVGDVQREFAGLSESMGETAATMGGALRRGTVGAISDFELMKVANKAMGAGFRGTATDMEDLASGSRLLAKRVGGDTVQAFDTLTTAIATGRVQSLAQLGLFVDQKRALEQHARALNKTTGELTKAEQQTALQTAAMAALRTVIADAGPQAADFGEKVDALKSGMKNFTDALAVAINDSPVVAAAMDAMGLGITQAFGSSKEELVRTLIRWVNEFAIKLTYVAEAAVFAGQIISNAFTAVKVVIAAMGGAAMMVAEGIATKIVELLQVAEALPGVGEKFAGMRAAMEETRTVIRGMKEDYAAQVGEALDGGNAQNAMLQSVKTTIQNTRAAMIAAKDAQVEHKAATDAGAVSMRNAAVASTQLTAAQKLAAEEAKKAAADYRAFLNWVGEREIEEHRLRIEAKKAADAEYRAFQNELGVRRMEQEALMYQSLEERAAQHGFATRAQLQQTAATALATYQEMQASGMFTTDTLQAAWEAYEAARRAAMGQSKETFLQTSAEWLSGTLQIFGVLGKKYKAAAIAGAIISTYQAVAKSLAASPWPKNLIAAAGALAAGLANVAKIKSSKEGFRAGTPNLDFARFLPQGQDITVHGREAIIPQGGGHQLADEIAESLGERETRSGDGGRPLVIHVMLPNGRELARAMVPELPRALAAHGLA